MISSQSVHESECGVSRCLGVHWAIVFKYSFSKGRQKFHYLFKYIRSALEMCRDRTNFRRNFFELFSFPLSRWLISSSLIQWATVCVKDAPQGIDDKLNQQWNLADATLSLNDLFPLFVFIKVRWHDEFQVTRDAFTRIRLRIKKKI